MLFQLKKKKGKPLFGFHLVFGFEVTPVTLSTPTQMGGNSSGSVLGLQSESKCCLASAVITKSKLEPREKCNSCRMARRRGELAASPLCLFLSPIKKKKKKAC